MRIACIGDSLTEGDYGIRGMGGVANVHRENYPYFLSRLMGCEVKNYGKCGFRSSGILDLYEKGEIIVTDCDKVLIMLGTNGGQEPEGDSFENTAYENLLLHIQADAPKAEIILLTPPNASMNKIYSNAGYMPQAEKAQKFTRRMAEKYGLRLFDVANFMYITPKNEYIMQSADGLHLTFMGYEKLAQYIYMLLAEERPLPLHTIALDSDIPLVAHRGLSGLECENTAASFIAAGNRSYYGIETDCWVTADGKFVCCHDPHTGRIAEKDLNIEKSNFADLRALKYKDYDRKTLSAELRMPIPEEYIRICKKYNKHCVFELKSRFTQEQIGAIVQIFRDADYLWNTTFISTSLDNLKLVRIFAPEQSCQVLHGFWDITPDWVERIGRELWENKMDLDVDYYCITKDAVDTLHALGIKVNVWTVDSPDMAKYLISCGVDFITTNILENHG